MPQEGTIKYTYTTKRTTANLATDEGGVTQNPNITVIVGNNLGFPVYERTFVFDPSKGYDEQGVLKLVKQEFNQNPPTMEAPNSLIWDVDPETGDIIIDQDWEGQSYPQEGDNIEFISDQEPIDYTFSSVIVSKETQTPLSSVQITDPNGKKVFSNSKGYFKIMGQFSPGEDFQLTIKKYGTRPSYGVLSIPITTQKGSLRNDIPFIELSPASKNINSEILKSQATSEEEKLRLSKEDMGNFVKQISEKAEDEIKRRLIPFIIKKLLCEPFGICDPISMLNKAKELKNKADKIKKDKASGGEYINIYENDPNYIENQRRIKEHDFSMLGPDDDLMLPVPTPGYIYVEEKNIWVPEGTDLNNPNQDFNKPVAKGEESGMTQETEGIGLNRPENMVQDFTFDPSQQFDFPINELEIPELITPPPPDKKKKKTKIKKYRYPKSKNKPHYLSKRKNKFFKVNKTSRRHKRGF